MSAAVVASPPVTEVVRASEMTARVIQRIAELRYPDRFENYRAELKRYEKRRNGRPETSGTVKLAFGSTTGPGFHLYGGQVFVPRPHQPSTVAYSYSQGSSMSWFGSKRYDPAQWFGLLPDSLFNRELRLPRIREYADEMRAGRWRDLFSDPISITADGHVLNGQHRIGAVEDVAQKPGWDAVGSDPAFLVVWGVNPAEAHYADGSKRTKNDEKAIADKLIAHLEKATGSS